MRHSSNFWTSSNLKDCDAPRRDWLSRGARQAFRFGVVCASTALGFRLYALPSRGQFRRYSIGELSCVRGTAKRNGVALHCANNHAGAWCPS